MINKLRAFSRGQWHLGMKVRLEMKVDSKAMVQYAGPRFPCLTEYLKDVEIYFFYDSIRAKESKKRGAEKLAAEVGEVISCSLFNQTRDTSSFIP